MDAVAPGMELSVVVIFVVLFYMVARECANSATCWIFRKFQTSAQRREASNGKGCPQDSEAEEVLQPVSEGFPYPRGFETARYLRRSHHSQYEAGIQRSYEPGDGGVEDASDEEGAEEEGAEEEDDEEESDEEEDAEEEDH